MRIDLFVRDGILPGAFWRRLEPAPAQPMPKMAWVGDALRKCCKGLEISQFNDEIFCSLALFAVGWLVHALNYLREKENWQVEVPSHALVINWRNIAFTTIKAKWKKTQWKQSGPINHLKRKSNCVCESFTSTFGERLQWPVVKFTHSRFCSFHLYKSYGIWIDVLAVASSSI